MSAAADKVIPFPLHRVSPVFPRNPLFFCERLQYRGYNQKVIEYCVVDVFAERVLEFSAGWFRSAEVGETWIPSNRALAGLALLHETVRGRVVIVDGVADEPPRRVLNACAHVIELGALYAYNGVQALRPQIEDEVASIRLAAFDGETTAFQTAARLREVWVLLDAELRGVRHDASPQSAPPPRPGPLQSPGPVSGPGPAAPPRSARGRRWRDCGDRLVTLSAWVLVALAALTAFVGVIFGHRDDILMELRHRVRF